MSVNIPVKVITTGEDYYNCLSDTLDKIYSCVSHTLGPVGAATIIDDIGMSRVYDDGKGIIESLEFEERDSNALLRIIRDSITDLNDKVGDASTTNFILTYSILKNLKDIRKRQVPRVIGGMKAAFEFLEMKILDNTKEVSIEDVYNIALVSSNSKEVAKIVSDTMKAIGLDSGFIHIKESNKSETSVEFNDGLLIESGCASLPLMAVAPDGKKISVEDCLVVVTDRNLNVFEDIVPIMEYSARVEQKPLVLFAGGFSNDVLATIYVNYRRDVCKTIPVVLPTFDSTEVIKDICAITGASLISSSVGKSMEDIVTKHKTSIGSIYTCLTYKNETRLISRKLDTNEYDSSNNVPIIIRINELKSQLEEAKEQEDIIQIKKIEKRLSAIQGGVAELSVAAPTKAELDYLKMKVEDCVASVKSCIEKGSVPLSSSFMYHLYYLLEDMIDTNEYIGGHPDIVYGARLVKEALLAPLEVIVNNANYDYSEVLNKMNQVSSIEEGYDILNDEICNLRDRKLLDSASTLIETLRCAISTSSALIRSKAIIAEEPIENQTIQPMSLGSMG